MSLLKWALFFFVLAAIAGLFGFTEHRRRRRGYRQGAVLHLPGGFRRHRHPGDDCVQDGYVSRRKIRDEEVSDGRKERYLW